MGNYGKGDGGVAKQGRQPREMLIRIPETPGIPAVLHEIATLCPRHSAAGYCRSTVILQFPSAYL